MANLSLSQILGRLRRRVIWIEGTSGFGWGLVVAALCLLIAVWLDLMVELSPTLRIGTVVAAALTAVMLLTWLVTRAIRKSVPDFLARRLDVVADTGGQIRSGVDLSESAAQPLHYANPVLTNGLAEMAVHRAAGLAGNVARSQAIPARPIRRPVGTLAFIAAVAGLIVLTLPRLASTEWLRFSDPFGDHPPYSRVQFQVQPEGATVVYGSGLDIHVAVDGPLVDDVELVLRPIRDAAPSSRPPSSEESIEEEVLPMFPEPGRRWRASIANITAPISYFVRSGRARSRQYTIDVITVPNIEGVRFRITAPKYAGLPVYEGELPQTGLTGLPGTTVRLWARSNRPLSAGTLTFVSKQKRLPLTLRPTADGGNEVTGTFAIRKSGRIDVRVVDESGQRSTEAFSAPVTLLADERPFVRLLEPRALSLATPTAVIPVVISAEDDYGISGGQLFRSLNDSRYLPMKLQIATPPPRRLHQVVSLPLSQYGLSPGDEIKLFARVVDNDPGGSPDHPQQTGPGKGAESSIALIRIISQAEFERMQRTRDGLNMLLSKYQQASRRMEGLADEIDKLQKELKQLPADSKLADKQRQQLKRLLNRMKEEAEALRKLSESKLPYDLDRQLTPHLEKLADALERLIKQTEALASNKGATNKSAANELAQMLEQLGRNRKQFKTNAGLPLELLAAIYPLSEDEMRFVEIYRRQRDLAERLASLKGRDGGDDPALKSRMRDLEEEQRKIRNDLAALLDDIEDHVARLPDDQRLDQLRETALKFVEAVRSSGATEAMIFAETGLAEFAGTRGHEGAKRAADILESFLKKCQGMGMQGAGGACLPTFQPRLADSLSWTIGQLLGDAGFGLGQQQGSSRGSGRGVGAGGGFSSRRSTLQNIGLYGGLPQYDLSPATGGGMGTIPSQGDQRSAARRMNSEGDAGTYRAADSLNASGTGEAVLPLRYRRKVGRYFQRIADEIGDQ